jgi:hypothetical protein
MTKRLAAALMIGAAIFLSSCNRSNVTSSGAPPSNTWDSMTWDQGSWG